MSKIDEGADWFTARCEVREEFLDREEELVEDANVAYETYWALVSLVVMHEPILREYYEEHDDEPKETFEKLMHELHAALILRTLDDVRDAPDVDAGE